MKLAMVLEGPISFDGKDYYAGKGEALYIESISRYFEEITICSYVLKSGDPTYTESLQHKFTAKNITIFAWPFATGNKFKTIKKICQLIMLSITFTKNIHKWDMFYILFPGYPAAITSILCRFFKKKYSVYLASDWPEETSFIIPWKGVIGKLLSPIYQSSTAYLQDKAIKNAQFTLVAGSHLANKYQSLTHNIKEIIPRLNWEQIILADEVEKITGKEINVLTVASLIERKGINYIIEAIKIYQTIYANANIFLHIVGDGEERTALENLTKELDIQNQVKFYGQMNHGKELMQLFRFADIFILPSVSGEGFPRVLYEAMSQGVPIITTNVCGIPLKVPNLERAIIVEPKDSNAIAAAIIELRDNTEVKQQLIRNGLAFMANLLVNKDHGKQFYDLVAAI